MNKEKFNSLEVLDQIKYINKELINNKSITSVSKMINVGRSTIRDRFKKLKYTYSKELNQYVYNDSVTDVVQKPIKSNNRVEANATHSEDNRCNTGVICNDDVVSNVINKSDEEVKKTLLDIVNNYDVLKEIIELHKCNTSVIKRQIIIDVEEAESKLTTVRVNSKELELFKEFCDDNKQYRKIDLISQALKEFRERYS